MSRPTNNEPNGYMEILGTVNSEKAILDVSHGMVNVGSPEWDALILSDVQAAESHVMSALATGTKPLILYDLQCDDDELGNLVNACLDHGLSCRVFWDGNHEFLPTMETWSPDFEDGGPHQVLLDSNGHPVIELSLVEAAMRDGRLEDEIRRLRERALLNVDQTIKRGPNLAAAFHG